MASQPTQRSLALLRKQGYLAEKVEHWNPFARRRIDLFGCVDLVAVTEKSILAVQTTTKSNMSSRMAKIRESPGARLWVLAGGRFHVHGWFKKSGRWEVKILKVRKTDFTKGSS